MNLSLNEIKQRALKCSQECKDFFQEDECDQKFLSKFFAVFGIDDRWLDFQKKVKVSETEGTKRIDCFCAKYKILVEQKSKGKNLDSAFSQAKNYLNGLTEKELPNYILVSDFERIRLYNLKKNPGDYYEFLLKDFSQKIHFFNFLTNRKEVKDIIEDPVNISASKLMGDLHDKLKENGYSGHDLEILLMRILFCFFAEDSGIFSHFQFQNFIENRTNIDGSDLGSRLHELFEILNTPETERQKNLDKEIDAFPYVNGNLFSNFIHIASFDSSMRAQLLKCVSFDWSRISPAIFGSLFQYIMDPKKRKNLGAHYTDEKNILRLIRPLFLDELHLEFKKAKNSREKLKTLHKKISNLTFLDPACGCGNFLVIVYRELRKLELKILKILHSDLIKETKALDISFEDILKIKLTNFYGIEIEDFSCEVAKVSMWLMEHQMNLEAGQCFGKNPPSIPLKKSANIIFDNALRIDWNNVILAKNCDYIIGNPPFYGKQLQTKEQKQDLSLVFHNRKGTKILDYVACWYQKSAEFIQSANTECAFVSTNSITQGEQVGILWENLIENHGIKINFAHLTFKWDNQASGKAQVFVVIIGFSKNFAKKCRLFEYENVKGEPREKLAKNINPYLVDASNIFIKNRSKPICKSPKMQFGNMPLDNGNFLFSNKEKKEFVNNEQQSKIFFREFLGAREFLHNEKKWCLWLKNANPSEIKKCPEILKRIENIKQYRLKSLRKKTQELANFSTLFAEDRQPESDYILIPSTTSENRKYIPIGFFTKNNILSNASFSIPNATLYHFGVLTSAMHMAWVRATCGRLKSDYRYSKDIVYNNFPWPEKITAKSREKIESCADEVLKIREKFPDSSLADLYDPLTMPPELVKAHLNLDKVVDLSYSQKKFVGDSDRVKFLFEKYEEIILRHNEK